MRKQKKISNVHMGVDHPITFRVNSQMLRELENIPERSRWIREAIKEKLEREHESKRFREILHSFT